MVSFKSKNLFICYLIKIIDFISLAPAAGFYEHVYAPLVLWLAPRNAGPYEAIKKEATDSVASFTCFHAGIALWLIHPGE